MRDDRVENQRAEVARLWLAFGEASERADATAALRDEALVRFRQGELDLEQAQAEQEQR